MGTPSSLPDFFNVAVSFLIAIIAIGILMFLQRGRAAGHDFSGAQETGKADLLLKQPFVKGALVLWIIRSIGFGCIYIYLLIRHHAISQGCVSGKTDPLLLVMIDGFSMFSLWTWFSVLRGSGYPGLWKTFIQICSAIMVIVPIDLALSARVSLWVLFPSALLNELSFGFAVGACAFRYKKESIPMIVAYSMYNWLQLPAYNAALMCNVEAEQWGVYYVLALGKMINFLLICDLLLKPVQEDKPLELLRLLRRPLAYVGGGPIVALIALIFVVIDRWAWIKTIPLNSLYLSVSILVPVVGLMLAFWEKLGKSKQTIAESTPGRMISITLLELTEGEYEEMRAKATREGVPPAEWIRAQLRVDRNEQRGMGASG